MTNYYSRSIEEQEIIRKAYDFEIAAIESGSAESNPYAGMLKAMGLWEAISDAVEMAYN